MRLAAAVVLLSAASILLVEPAPSYDPWAWLLWGRELAHGTLSTAEGPAFKPLPVFVCVPLSLLGDAAPEAWVVLARAAAIGALLLAFLLVRSWAGTAAGLIAAAAVALTGSFANLTATGQIEPMVVFFALAGLLAWQREMRRAALAAGVAVALLRVEAWPFLALLGIVLWPQHRRLVLAAAVAVPLLWFVPEWIGSGDPLRSGTRARVPNPGQPALADVPFFASLQDAVALPLLPVWIAIAVLAVRRGPGALVAAAGAAWVVLVAIMAQAGFSGEARYAVPGAALLAVAAAAQIQRPRWLAVAAVGAVAIAAIPRLADVADVRDRQAYQARLIDDLDAAIAAAGGRTQLLRCGRPYTGPYRGPLTAYALDVEKQRVGFVPRAPAVVLRSALREGERPQPALLREGAATRRGLWTVQTTC